uniref:Transmembrane protein 87A n=1 Tax=Panagrolaimus sp. JU765 TaxID=591449 RepID=A0AC34Q679_9BILA
MRLLLFFLFYALPNCANGNLLIPGIIKREVTITPSKTEYYGFFQSALNSSEVQIRLSCEQDLNEKFSVQYVLRSTPCAKEFYLDTSRVAHINETLEDYFDNENNIPFGFHYDSIYFYRSESRIFSCEKHMDIFLDNFIHPKMERRNVTENTKRNKREAFLNGDSIDGGAKMSLTSWHPAQVLLTDAIYILIVKINYAGDASKAVDLSKSFKVQLEVQWRNPHGYLSAIDYPLLRFYQFMCILYIILSMIWLIVCFKHWKDLLRIQFWIGAVIIIGMIEKAVFYAEYANMNDVGESVEGLIELAELMSCLKRTMAHVLIIIVSVGYGVVKPRLGSTLNQVAAVGVLYFVFCSIEGLTRVSKASVEAMKEKTVARIPLVAFEFGIAYWIFTSLISTMRSLRMRRNEVKYALYRNFTNILCVAVFAAVIHMSWSIYIHSIEHCLSDWKQLWIDTAFWHIFFCSILMVVMYLWRPAVNNQRYAFTPLLDNSEDENDDELFNSQIAAYDVVKHRQLESQSRENRAYEYNADDKLEDDLKWIESNIPSTLAEALVDDDEEIEMRKLEASKML